MGTNDQGRLGSRHSVRRVARSAGPPSRRAPCDVRVASAPSRQATAATPGLVAAYGFDEGSGTTVTDQSGSGHTGTVANTTWAATGKYGKALQFNGSSALVTIPDAAALHLTTGMTLEAWVNPTTVNGNWRDVIYKGNDNYYLEATSTNASKPDAGLIAGGSYADAYGTAALTANSWTLPGRNLRRHQRPPVRQRHPGRLDRPHRLDQHLHQPAADRRRQPLRPKLRRHDRRSPHLQHRPHPHPNPNRPNHTDHPDRADVFGRRVGVGVVGDGGVAGQRRRRSERERERPVHVRDQVGVRGGVRGHGEDQPVRPNLLGLERVRDDRPQPTSPHVAVTCQGPPIGRRARHRATATASAPPTPPATTQSPYTQHRHRAPRSTPDTTVRRRSPER